MQQLQDVVSILDECNLKFWLDSGSLLGIVRESRLLPQDPDIDISLWAGQEHELSEALARLQRFGYSLTTFSHAGGRYGIGHKLEPRIGAAANWRSVDIKVFQPIGAYACSAYWNGIALDSSNKLALALWRLLRGVAWRLWRHVFPGASPEAGVLSTFVQLHYWVVPGHFFDEQIRHETGYPIPAAYDAYLSARYGQWRVPQTDWNYERDDPFYVKELPEGAYKA